MDIQTNLFDFLYDNYKITKSIRLIECFAGYGSQALSLKYLGVEFEHWKICEWATKSIQAYKDAHFTNDNTNYSKDLTQEQVIDFLFKKGVSMNYNEPMSYEQIKRKGEEWQRVTYNNIIATHNLVNISQVKGKDLEITDTDKYDYILTYSFPCQDLSLAGKRAGMEKDSGTRSGLLWEVERILDECKVLGNLPKILLMENVPEVVGTNNIEHFLKWRYKLEELGYSNYDKILNAKDFGIPQNRRRCFMISVYGNYNYKFPKSKKTIPRLRNILENEVRDKYYLKQTLISEIKTTLIKFGTYFTFKDKKTGEINLPRNRISNINNFALTITTSNPQKILLDNGKIRTITPKESWRLMGVKDEDFFNVAKNQSDASLYHLAGDSIVVDVLMAIFKQLL